MEQFGHEHEGQDPDHIENISFADFNHNQLIACFLLELSEKYDTTNDASCFVSEKVSHILQLENKVRYAVFQESIRRNNPNFVIDHETETLLTCESPSSIAFKKFSGKKTLNEFIKKQTHFVAPKQINMGFDPVSQKADSIQHVPIESTLRAILSHEDVLAYTLQQNETKNGVYKSFRDGAAYKNNLFLNSTPNVLELCIYHDDFSIVNPLGNKTHKHKISAFYFVLGNFPSKFRSRLSDIHLILLSPTSLVAKYGYGSLLSPLRI